MISFLRSNFNPERLFTWPVFLITLGWALSTNLLDTVFNPANLYPERIASVVFAHLVMFLVIFLGILILRKLPQLARALLMIPLVVISTIARGFTLWSLFSVIGIDSPDVFLYRVFGPITNMGLPLAISAIAVHRIRSYTENRKLLLSESYRLLELKKIARERIRRTTEARLDRIRSEILGSLALGSDKSPEQTMSLITKTIDNVVRPTSHEIEAESFSLESASEEIGEVKLNWKEALSDSFNPKFIQPIAVGLTAFIAAIFFVTNSNTPSDAAFLLVLLSFGTWLFLSLAKLLLSFIYNKVSALVGKLAFLLLVPLAATAVGVLSLVVTLQTENPYALLFVAPYFITGLTVLYALAGSAESQAIEANNRLAELSGNLAWEVSRISGEQRQLQRSLAHLLHGRIQTVLTSSLMRLKIAAQEKPENLSEIEASIRTELQELIETAKVEEASNNLTLDQNLTQLDQTWEDIAAIKLESKGIEPEELAQDPILMATLSELFSELTFNAIKHGGAKSVEFTISKSEDNIITLACSDNGTRPPDSSRVGLGTRLLDECALSWNRQSTDSGTTTILQLPFAPKVQTN